MADWEFGTTGFHDPEEVRRRNVNGLEGAALAEAARHHLAARGEACGEVFPEDFGWVFEASGPEGRYLCAFAIEADDNGARVGHASVTKWRSALDRVLGRNHQAGDEAMPRAVEAFLRGHPDIGDAEHGPA
jgi:hypothetical protein